jgi:hypothetical protein
MNIEKWFQFLALKQCDYMWKLQGVGYKCTTLLIQLNRENVVV